MRAALLALLACAAALAGCSAAGPQADGCPQHGHATVVSGDPASTADPRQPSDALYVVTGLDAALPARVTANATDGTGMDYGSGAPVPVERTEFNSSVPSQRLERLRLQPGDLARGLDVTWRIAYAVPAGCDGAGGGLVHNLGAHPEEGKVLTPGHGAHVWYAGFWENGTLFETNLEAFDHSAWPKADWYQSVPYEPLPVYVYGQDRSEEPAYWKPLPSPAPTGTPVDGPVGTAAAAPGLGYYSTIRGFNDGLKGLSTTSTRVIWMDAKDAYPEGTPNNPLAGDNLVFLVRLADVVDQPCPSPPVVGETPCPPQP
jgi:hypothetical protein